MVYVHANTPASANRAYSLPTGIFKKMRLTAKVMRAFTAKHDRSPNDQEVYDLIHAKMTPTGSAGSHMTLENIRLCRRLLSEKHYSLNTYYTPNEDEKDAHSLIGNIADTEMDVENCGQTTLSR